MDKVRAERARLAPILAAYAPRDCWNCDETGLFKDAPPDRGLCSVKMSGRKVSKDRITLLFMCNEDGSEKDKILFIGKAKNPRCFKQRSPAAYGFRYFHNKKAWMKGDIFEEYICMLFAQLPVLLTFAHMKLAQGL